MSGILLQSIQESQKLQLESEMDIADHRPLYTMDTGPKVCGIYMYVPSGELCRAIGQ